MSNLFKLLPIIFIAAMAIGTTSYFFSTINSAKAEQEIQKETMRNQNCKVIEIIQANSILSEQQYRYSCDNGIFYTVNFKIDKEVSK